ncbi:MAG: hypothetical protein E5V85_32450 [Mesorhizobium sp.]|nr:MAG: hypothetical protein E5V85_32450 [Mesorhizobium sp.]
MSTLDRFVVSRNEEPIHRSWFCSQFLTGKPLHTFPELLCLTQFLTENRFTLFLELLWAKALFTGL